MINLLTILANVWANELRKMEEYIIIIFALSYEIWRSVLTLHIKDSILVWLKSLFSLYVSGSW